MGDALKEALELKGWLAKQGDGLISRYQDRYWKIIDNGRTLAYYYDEKESLNFKQTRGQIAIISILKIDLGDKPEEFHLIVDGRTYKMKARSHEEQQKWVKGLQTLMDNVRNEDLKSKERFAGTSIKFECEHKEAAYNERSKTDTFILFKPIGFVAGAAKKIVVDTTIGTAVKVTKKIGGVATGRNTDDSDFDHEEYLKKKDYYSYFSQIPEEIRHSRLIMGFMEIEDKALEGIYVVKDVLHDSGLRDKEQRKWLMMISQKPVIPSLEAEDDEETLAENVLPPEINFNVVYFFSDDVNASKPEFSVAMKDILGITVKSKNTKEHIYKWVIDLGEKKHFLQSNSLSEREKWLIAIDCAMKTATEISRSKTKTLKNINQIIRVFNTAAETQNPELIKNKIAADYEKSGGSQLQKQLNDLPQFIAVTRKISEEYIAVLNASCAMKNKRLDIIKEYANQFHGQLMKAWAEFFTSVQVYEICICMDEYKRILRLFGECFVDTRLSDTIRLLTRSLGHKLLSVDLDELDRILKAEIESKPSLNTTLRPITCGPEKLWALVQGVFKFCQQCKVSDFIYELLTICEEMVIYYQSGSALILENVPLSLEHYFAFCNSMEGNDNKCDQFIVFVKKISSFNDTEISQFFDGKEIKSYNKELASVSLTNIVKIWFNYLKQDFKKPILAVDIDSILAGLSKLIKDAVTKLRDDYTTKLWRICFQQITYFYMTSVLEMPKAKKEVDLISRLILKIDDDLNRIIKFFQTGKIDKPTIEKNTKPILDFKIFLSCNPALLGIACQSLKRDFPEEINAKVLCSFIDMRNDMDENEKKDSNLTVKEALEIIEKDRSVGESKDQEFVRRKSTRTQTFSSLNKTETGSLLAQGLTLSVSKSLEGGSESARGKKSDNNEMEGYLDVFQDKFAVAVASIFDSKIEWKPHFFSIKNLNLFCYKDHKSHRAEFKLGLETLDSCDSFKENEFKLAFEDGKKLTLRAKDVKEASAWMDAIHENNAKALMLPAASVVLKVIIYKDTSSIIKDIEFYPKKSFDLNKVNKKSHNPNDNFAWVQGFIDPAPKDTSKAKKSERTESLSSTMADSKHMNNLSFADQSVVADDEAPGCCNKFCGIFGFGKRADTTGYQKIQ